MTSLQHHIAVAQPAPRHEETQALDNYVLATRIVHRAETLLPHAEGFPVALGLVEAAFAAALDITASSTWAEVRAARDFLDAAHDELDRAGYQVR
ncbi:hypothetical protein F0U44_08300 [Nocardioides humilatus]|uniref:Uncharacterized protein n=1 Tax=Nocardioides humilatus TaxID=2607660 RepID=A0A5B1LCM5_9ACTN|nr:hypothetical protein [Nocardioides humilatus]KAA1418501.1 hypothetical protein F0U44_08300 [Nocardioides humilatus]